MIRGRQAICRLGCRGIHHCYELPAQAIFKTGRLSIHYSSINVWRDRSC